MPKGQYDSQFRRGRRQPLEVRFWEKVDRKGPDECWPWIGARLKSGMDYGQFQLNGSPRLAHRVAWELTNGPIPEGIKVLHTCDNPPCCNVEKHLFLGSNTDNMKDMAAKGRGRLQRPFNRATGDRHGMHLHPERVRRGEAHPKALLTERQVAEMRRLHRDGTPQAELVRLFGIEKTVVSKIVNKRTWKHVPDELPY